MSIWGRSRDRHLSSKCNIQDIRTGMYSENLKHFLRILMLLWMESLMILKYGLDYADVDQSSYKLGCVHACLLKDHDMSSVLRQD